MLKPLKRAAFFVGHSSRVFAARLLPIRYGAPIKLLVDAETAGLNLNNNLTIDGNDHALKFTDKGIALWGHALVLKDINASMADIGSTPYTAEWNWVSVCANKDASLTLDDATLTMDGAGALRRPPTRLSSCRLMALGVRLQYAASD